MGKNTLIICCVLLCVAILNLSVVNAGFINNYICFCCYAAIVAFVARDYKKRKEAES